MPFEQYIKESTRRSPGVVLKPGRIFIMGRSIPDDPGDFYAPIIDKISEYISDYSGQTRVDLGFEYINTASAKWISLILRKLSELKNATNDMSVTWYYELGDEDMSDLGFILRSLVECPFLVSEVKKMNQELYKRILSSSNQPN